ncbi:MAG: fluoride efflux transporter CrcB [Magnetococcales bacterium]|nr:fluoride efflux transporter CrcB [Magnetococcales bacterium]
MNTLLWIAGGGAIGAVSRYLISNAVYDWLGKGFPWGTLVVNVLGSFLMGLLSYLFISGKIPVSVEVRSAILVGMLGALTTFSTFANDNWLLLDDGQLGLALFNMIISVVLCVLAVWLGGLTARGFG